MKYVARFLFSPFGRTGRRLYWLFFVLPLAALALGTRAYERWSGELIPFEAVLVASPFLLWLQGAVIARRLQDIGMTGWLALVFVLAAPVLLFAGYGELASTVQIMLFVACLAVGAIPGQKGANRFGPDPLGARS